jgi:hypothetical protein
MVPTNSSKNWIRTVPRLFDITFSSTCGCSVDYIDDNLVTERLVNSVQKNQEIVVYSFGMPKNLANGPTRPRYDRYRPKQLSYPVRFLSFPNCHFGAIKAVLAASGHVRQAVWQGPAKLAHQTDDNEWYVVFWNFFFKVVSCAITRSFWTKTCFTADNGLWSLLLVSVPMIWHYWVEIRRLFSVDQAHVYKSSAMYFGRLRRWYWYSGWLRRLYFVFCRRTRFIHGLLII